MRIFLLILRYLFYYLKSFYPHISDIVCLYFRTHLNIILHTYLSIYYVFVFVSLTCMYMLYFPFTSHSILTHLICFCTHISLILSKPFFFAILVLHTLAFHTHLVLTFYFQKRSFTHICTLFFENIRIWIIVLQGYVSDEIGTYSFVIQVQINRMLDVPFGT